MKLMQKAAMLNPASLGGSFTLPYEIYHRTLVTLTSNDLTFGSKNSSMTSTIERVPQKANSRKGRSFLGFDYLGRFTSATYELVVTAASDWADKYEWGKRFGHRVRIRVSEENRPFIDVFRETYEDEEDEETNEVVAFMLRYPSSPRWEDRLTQVSEFCQGADFVIVNFIPDDPNNPRLKDAQEPRAWIFDCHLNPQIPVPTNPLHDRLLTNMEFHEALKQERFSQDSEQEIIGNTRRIYISNPNGVSILSLLRRTPASQVEGFRKLFANYLSPSPVPELSLRETDWWGLGFVIECNLPYLAISTHDRSDTRTLSKDKNLRARDDIDFLNLNSSTTPRDQQQRSCVPDNAVLHVAVFSLMITGRSEQHSTTVCLDDEFFDQESRLMSDEEIESLAGREDPITLQPEFKRARSPRAYLLVALEGQLERIVDYHANAQDRLKYSTELYNTISEDRSPAMDQWIKRFPLILNKLVHFNSRLAEKVNHFLTDDSMVGSDGIPYGPLWQGLQAEPGAIKSLRAIRRYCSQLRDINTGLEHLREAYEDVRRKRKNDFAAEQQTRDRTIEQVTIAAFGLAIMNLIAQVYTGKPGNDDASSRPAYITMVVSFGAICISGILCGIETLLGKVGLDTPVPDFPDADIVHNPQDIFRVYLADTLQKLVNCDRLVAYDAIQTSNITGMGDLIIVAPRLRLKGVKPEELAKDLLQKLPRTPPFGCPLLDGIRLQVFFSPNTLSRLLLSYISDRSSSYGYDTSLGLVDPTSTDGQKKKVIVEFSSPNMASEFQVSHLRSTLIGTYIANIHSSMGWEVVKMNYLGDWGKQIGLLAAGWQRFGSEEEFEKQPLRHLLEVNHKIQDLFKPELEECKTAKANKQDVTDIESRGLYAERDAFFKKMEDSDPEAIALWQRFRDATVKDYPESYAQLGVTFDEYSGESQVTAESIAEVEQILKDKGIYEEHDDSFMIDFSKHDVRGLSLAVLRYRNGTTSYLLRDLAAVFDRYKKHKFDKMIYVVAMEQEMHFHRVTKTLELMGRQDLAERIQHVSFAKINGLPEELKGAELLSDYLGRCRSMAQTSLDEEEETSHVDKSENSARQLSLAGLFIQDHYHKRNTSYAVDPKKSLSLEGETGAAIQNCYARLLKKLESGPGSFDYATLDHTSLETEDYAELLRILLQYPDAAHGSFRTLEPSFIVVYLLRIVDQLTATLDDDDEKDWTGLDAASEARYALYENARQVFENALRLLGVSPWSA
ncbi:arginyl-tRNA synthetase [Fusarium tjaetaba]|uniref:arginine--tRNA ligase n=1 Tax=Fusarium tjaetaba TaxID=1567544 RepID=A0A8H5RLI0_9HYPO|nr:arginyl-tRNA synthetase [Fusarium tjaetaba]KAF5635473.1 arginyl-tRNA synthetase [Fusarium tjaetaba]